MKDAKLIEILEEHKYHLKEKLAANIRACEQYNDAGDRGACYAHQVTPVEAEIKKTVQCIAMVTKEKS